MKYTPGFTVIRLFCISSVLFCCFVVERYARTNAAFLVSPPFLLPAYMHKALAGTPTNSPPVAVNDSYTVHGSTSIGPFLANDHDPDDDSITFYDIVTLPAHGTLNGGTQPDRKSYTPNQGYVGADSFTYRIRDSFLNVSAPATVTLDVVNQSPTAIADFYTVHRSLPTTVQNGLLANDSDPDGDSFSLSNPSNGAPRATPHGTIRTYSNGTFIYTPAYGYVGIDTFDHTVCDSLGGCTNATATFNVVNQSPAGMGDFYIVYGSITTTASNGLIANDSDPDNDAFNLANPSNGALRWTANGRIATYSNGSFSYYPGSGFTGADAYVYQVCDDLGACSDATVNFLVLSGPGSGAKVPHSGCPPTDPPVQYCFTPQLGGFSPNHGRRWRSIRPSKW